MATLRTHNTRRARRRRQIIFLEAFRYHMDRIERLTRAGRLDKLRDSGWVRRKLRGPGRPF